MKIMIGTPCYDGRLDVWHVNSLMNTIKMSKGLDIEIIPIWVSFDALICRARNDTIKLALESNADALVFIDSDIEWNPEDFFKLIFSEHDVIGGTYRKKHDNVEEYVLKIDKLSEIDEAGILPVNGLGTGFVKLTKEALQFLWDNSEEYIDKKDNKPVRAICEVVIENNDLVSEDITMFNKLKRGGWNVYLDTSITCNHSGSKKFIGNFRNWYDNILKEAE